MNYGPGGPCLLCGHGFQCSGDYYGNWNNGERTFEDPLNTFVNSIRIKVFGNSCLSTSIEVSLNENVLGTLASLSDKCLCGDCYTSSDTFTFNQSWYNIGGSNTIKLRSIISGPIICVDRVELDLFTPPSPSKSPTLAPTAYQIIKTDDCTDDDSGTFTLFNVKEKVECSWLTKNNKKTEIRKQKHCGRDEVKNLCQSTCGECTACDERGHLHSS